MCSRMKPARFIGTHESSVAKLVSSQCLSWIPWSTLRTTKPSLKLRDCRIDMKCECKTTHICDNEASYVVLRNKVMRFVCNECYFNTDTTVRNLFTGETHWENRT